MLSRSPNLIVRKVSTLLACVTLLFAFPAVLAAASESCHIHPPGWEVKEPDPRGLELFGSLQECEAANVRAYGGRGRCHCIPDIFTNRERRDFWFAPPEYFAPRERLY